MESVIMKDRENSIIFGLIEANALIEHSHLDWSYIIQKCYIHRLLCRLFNHTKYSLELPKHYLHLLQNDYDLANYRSFNQQKEFLNVLKELKNNGINSILLKGVYLSEKCYQSLAERPFVDMDILIQKEDASRIFKVLKELGYIQGSYNRKTQKVDIIDQNRLTGYEVELQHYGEFVKPNESKLLDCFKIDVHHRLNTVFDSFGYDINDLFERAVEDDISGVPFLRLSNEDFLMHLISHLYWHTLSIREIIKGRDIRLLNYYDIYLFLKKHPVNWSALIERAEKYGLNNAFYYVLYHCQLIYGNLIPEDIYNSWDEEYMKEISNTIFDRWFTRDTVTPVGKWKTNFLDRIFDDSRKNEALSSFYNDYINNILFTGSYFRIVDINSEDRFS